MHIHQRIIIITLMLLFLTNIGNCEFRVSNNNPEKIHEITAQYVNDKAVVGPLFKNTDNGYSFDIYGLKHYINETVKVSLTTNEYEHTTHVTLVGSSMGLGEDSLFMAAMLDISYAIGMSYNEIDLAARNFERRATGGGKYVSYSSRPFISSVQNNICIFLFFNKESGRSICEFREPM